MMEEKHSVLLVEDEAVVRNSLPEWLREDGYDVATAGDGKGALELLEKILLEKPGPERACIHMLTGDVSYRLCSNLYRCHKCSFNEHMLDKGKH